MSNVEDEEKALSKVSSDGKSEVKNPTSYTLLPAPVASLVSLVTKSSSLYLRIGTFVGGLAIDGARTGTLTGIELSRAVVESILSRAGGDVVARSTGELGKAEAESMLERSVGQLVLGWVPRINDDRYLYFILH
jgi:hypothetical protein